MKALIQLLIIWSTLILPLRESRWEFEYKSDVGSTSNHTYWSMDKKFIMTIMNFILNIYEFHKQSSEQMRFILTNVVFIFIMLRGTQHRSQSPRKHYTVDRVWAMFIW